MLVVPASTETTLLSQCPLHEQWSCRTLWVRDLRSKLWQFGCTLPKTSQFSTAPKRSQQSHFQNVNCRYAVHFCPNYRTYKMWSSSVDGCVECAKNRLSGWKNCRKSRFLAIIIIKLRGFLRRYPSSNKSSLPIIQFNTNIQGWYFMLIFHLVGHERVCIAKKMYECFSTPFSTYYIPHWVVDIIKS